MAQKQTEPTNNIVETSKRISRGRALRILQLLVHGHEIMIRTHPDSEEIRAMYLTKTAEGMLREARSTFDPFGRIQWLRDAYELLSELGIDINDIRISS